MMKRTFFDILNRFNINLVDHKSLFSRFLYGILIIFAIFIIYFLNFGYYFLKLFISVIIFNYIFNKFTYSDNLLIRLVQKAILYSICVYFSLYLLVYLDLFDTIHCDSTEDEDNNDNNNNDDDNNNNDVTLTSTTTSNDNVSSTNQTKENSSTLDNNTNANVEKNKRSSFEILIDAGVKIWQDMDLDNTAITAGGAASSAVAKSMAGAPLHAKALAVGVVGVTTTVSTRAGIDIYHAIADNNNIIENIEENVKTHPYSDPDIDSVPSPDSTFINSPLENVESGDGTHSYLYLELC